MTEPVRARDPAGMSRTLAENIRTLEDRRRREAASASAGERVAARITAFTGSMTFVAVHVVLYGAWIAVNLGRVPGVRPFDPSFVMLAMEASVEAIFLSTFVLISQNRMMAAADRRGDLDLHINLLAEHELTKVAALLERIAERLDIGERDPEFEEVKQDVRADRVLDALDAEQAAETAAPNRSPIDRGLTEPSVEARATPAPRAESDRGS